MSLCLDACGYVFVHLDPCEHMYCRADLRSLRSLRRRCCGTVLRYVGTFGCEIEAKLKANPGQAGATRNTKRHADLTSNFLDFGVDFSPSWSQVGAKNQPKWVQNPAKLRPSWGMELELRF